MDALHLAELEGLPQEKRDKLGFVAVQVAHLIRAARLNPVVVLRP